jgi:hypothetical protein
MNPDQQPGDLVTTYTYSYDSGDRLTVLGAPAGQGPQPTAAPSEPRPENEKTAPPWTFEHDKPKGIYRLTWSDGETDVFRDNPTLYLVIEPDSKTGEMKPVLTRGWPTLLYLVRQEREVR